jgi:ubiquinone/menaquinone biosynthesis C-methylase UbiE
MRKNKPWYATGFDDNYPLMQTYEESITELQALSVELLLNLRPGAHILDLCCGYGRHSQSWRKNGYDPVGLDLSADLLEIASQDPSPGKWIRGDVRHLPFSSESFEAATFMFISFGYFDTEEEDLTALQEVWRILSPGGGLYLDIKHPAYLRGNPMPDASFDLQGAVVTETSRIVQVSGRERHEIRRTLQHSDRPMRNYYYSVRLYEPNDIQSLMERAGFRRVRLYGGYDGRALSPEAPRIIAIGQR